MPFDKGVHRQTEEQGHRQDVFAAAEVGEKGLVGESGGDVAEHLPHIPQGRADALSPEQNPAQQHHEPYIQVREDAQLFGEAEGLLGHQQNEVEQAPGHKSPVCAVPNAREGPDHKDVKYLTVAGDPVAAQGDIDVIAEPGA